MLSFRISTQEARSAHELSQGGVGFMVSGIRVQGVT